MRRRSTRKQKGRGCGCGGMEMLGFPKSGGFTSLFGGQESTSQMMNSVGENSQMKKQSSDGMISSQNYQPRMKQSQEQEMPKAMGVSYPTMRKPEIPQEPTMSVMDNQEDMMRPSGPRGRQGREQSIKKSQIPSAIGRELRRIKEDIQMLKDQVSDLQNNNPSGNSSPGLFGGRRKTLRRMRKHRR